MGVNGPVVEEALASAGLDMRNLDSRRSLILIWTVDTPSSDRCTICVSRSRV